MIRHDLDGFPTRTAMHLAELHEAAARCRLANEARAAQREQAARETARRPAAAPLHLARALLVWLRGRRPARA